MMKITFFTRVECKPPVPLCSLMKARILLDAYFTISPSKVAVITQAPKPLEIVWEDRNPDPIWVTALKIASYVVLAPFALLAFIAKCALYRKPLNDLLDRALSPIVAKCDALCDLVKRGESADDHPKVKAALAEIVKDKAKAEWALGRLERVFKPNFPRSGAKKDYPNGSLLTTQQKTYLKNYIAIKTQLIEAFLPKGDQQRQWYLFKERTVVQKVMCDAWVTLLNNVYSQKDNYMSGYDALKTYYQDVLDCYAVNFAAAGFDKSKFARQARSEVRSLLIQMATQHWTEFYLTFTKRVVYLLGGLTDLFPKLQETLTIIACVHAFHEQCSQGNATITGLNSLLDEALLSN